MFQMQLKK